MQRGQGFFRGQGFVKVAPAGAQARRGRMTTTLREDAVAFESSAQAAAWSLVIVHHPDPRLLGVRRVVSRGSGLDLGRSSPAFGEGALDEPLMSRAHARLAVSPAGELAVSDLGSANGTWIDGERVAEGHLRHGSVVRTGAVLFAVQHGPETYPLRRSERCPAIAWCTVDFVERLRGRIAARSVIAVAGVGGTAWRGHLGRVVEELGLKVGDAPTLAAARSRDRNTVCVVDAGAKDLDDPDALRGGSGAAAAIVIDGAVNSTAIETLVMPSMRERVEDLPWLLRAALLRAVGHVPDMDVGFVTRLLCAEWPEDLDGLEGWADAVARRPERHARLVWTGDDLAHTGGPRRRGETAPPPPSGPTDALTIARDGTWFRVGTEAPVDLRTRFALARVLRALLAAREEDSGSMLSLEAMVKAGWPGERLVSDSSANRVYVAVATLRKLGFRTLLERREGGYRLSPRALMRGCELDFDDAGKPDVGA